MGRRVLITSPPLLGHIHPMVPLARAMVDRGHMVLWALPANGVEEVEGSGIAAAAVAPPMPVGPQLAKQRFPELATLPPSEMPEAMFGKLFGAILAPEMLAGLEPVAREWRPDLVVSDAAEFSGHIVAAELGVPSITKGFGPLLPEPRVAAAADEVAALWRSRGLEPRPYGGAYETLYLDDYPPLMQPQTHKHVLRRQLMRPERHDGVSSPSGPPLLPTGRPDAPLIYVTMGTVFNDPEPMRVILGALEPLPARVLVTLGPHGDPSTFGHRPPHVRVERYVPQSAVLEHCDLVICHGGSGTTLGALAFGRPILCLPQGADQFLNAIAITSVGAGLAIPPDQFTTEAVAAAVGRLLADPSFCAEAMKVRDAISLMPSVDEAVAVFEAFQ